MNSTNTLTWVVLEDAKYSCRIGCTEQERAFPQQISVSLRVAIRNSELGKNYELCQTVCWESLNNLLGEMCESKPWILVEDLAEELSAKLFESYEQIVSLKIQLKKFPFPNVSWVGVEIERNSVRTS